MLDIFNRGLLFITNITGYTSGKYSWKSYPVQRNSLATDMHPPCFAKASQGRDFSIDYPLGINPFDLRFTIVIEIVHPSAVLPSTNSEQAGQATFRDDIVGAGRGKRVYAHFG
jgi:hypothetical protein